MTSHSVPLLLFQEGNNYHMPSEAEEILKTFGDESIAVVSVIGKPKTGKSYILNHIASDPGAFEVNAQVTKSTKGIQMSARIYNLEGTKVLLLDNQSFNSSCNSIHDSRIFFVNMLLSSVLLYNNFGVIDQQALSHLSLIIGLGQMSETAINQEWKVEKPHLLWLVRDFILKLESKSGEAFTTKQYLETILNDQKGLTSSIVQKNCVRTMIKDMFDKRDCETLVRPAREEKDLHMLSKIPFSELRKQFLNDVFRVKSKLSKCIKYKKVNGQLLTGNLILKLVKACVNSFNNGSKSGAPILHGIWEMVQSEQRREVSSYLEGICEQIQKQHLKGAIVSVEQYWDQQIKSINTLNNPQIIHMIRERKQELLSNIQDSRDLIVPVTFDAINLNFMESVIHKDRLEDGFQSFNKFSKKSKDAKHVSQRQSRCSITTNVEKELESTKRELMFMKEKCSEFQKERESILKAIEAKDKHIVDITSRRRDSLLGKGDEDQSSIVVKLLEMYQKMEEKYEKINEMSKNTLAYICSHCKAKFQPHEFQKHLEKIKVEDLSEIKVLTPVSHKHTRTDRIEHSISEAPHQPKASFFTPYIIIPKGTLAVDIEKTLIKEDQQHRNYIEYIIKVTLKHSKWTINRKYKDFCELHDILMIMLPQLDFPDSSALIKVGMLTSVSNNVNKKNIVEERRKTLQNYLTEIIGIDEVRNTRILQKFLKINQEYKELEYIEEPHHKSKSPFSSEFKPETRGTAQRAQTSYTQTKKYNQSRVR